MNNIELRDFWIKSSDRDYDSMEAMHKIQRNTWCLFVGHLVIEKLLKGLYAQNNLDNPYAPKVHNLILLSQKSKLKIPENIKSKIQIINTFNIGARYEDYKDDFYNKCTNEYTSEQVNNIMEVRKWLKEQLIEK